MSEQLLLDLRSTNVKNLEDVLIPHINKGFLTMYNQLSKQNKESTLINFQLYLFTMFISTTFIILHFMFDMPIYINV